MDTIRITHRGLLLALVLMFSWNSVWCGCQKLAPTHMLCSYLTELPQISNRRISILVINNGTLGNINKNHFNKDSITLRKLIMRNVKITDVEGDSFKMLTKLEELDLSENKLNILKKTTFLGLNSLKTLILSENDISFLESETFSTLRSLEDVQLNSNKIVYLPPDIFKWNSKLIELDISNNNIKLPKNGPFINSDSIEMLHMKNCNLNYLPKDMFYKMPNLQELFIINNNIEILPEGWFFLTPNIKYIDISNNNLSNDKNKHCGVLNKDVEIEEIGLDNNPLSLDSDNFIAVLKIQCTKKMSEEKLTLLMNKAKTITSIIITTPANVYTNKNSNFTFTQSTSAPTIRRPSTENVNNLKNNKYINSSQQQLKTTETKYFTKKINQKLTIVEIPVETIKQFEEDIPSRSTPGSFADKSTSTISITETSSQNVFIPDFQNNFDENGHNVPSENDKNSGIYIDKITILLILYGIIFIMVASFTVIISYKLIKSCPSSKNTNDNQERKLAPPRKQTPPKNN